MQNIKAIFFDLDGTLLDSKEQLSQRTKEALVALSKTEVLLVIATARPPRMVQSLDPLLHHLGPIIYYNGAFAKDVQKNWMFHKTIDQSVNEAFFHSISDSNQLLTMEANDEWFANRLLTEGELQLFQSSVQPEILGAETWCTYRPCKLLLPKPEDISPLKRQFDKHLTFTASQGGHLLEIMAEGVGKEKAILQLIENYGISPQDAMAFGDDYNDLGMLSKLGHTYAMDNAIYEAKAAATSVTTSNEEDGVAIVLEKLLKIRGSIGLS